MTNIIIPLQIYQVYIGLGLRALALLLMTVVLFRMWKELRDNNHLRRTKVLLFILGSAFFVGSFIPVQQNLCYILHCLDLNSIIYVGIITALLNLISVAIFVILYFTKDE